MRATIAAAASAALAGAVAAQAPPLPRTAPPQELLQRLAPPAAPELAPSVQPPPLVERSGPGAAQRIRIASVSVGPQAALPAARLEALVAPLAGRTVAVAEIESARIALLRAYRDAGYPFTAVDAGLTPGPDGFALRFAFTEGFIAEVRLEGDIGPAGTQVLRFLSPLTQQRPLAASTLERRLLLSNDIAGVSVRGVLRPIPGEPGALQLVAQVTRTPFFGYVTADNRAAEFTGPMQALAVFQANAFSALGERTELALYWAERDTQRFAQASTELFLGGSGLRLRVFGGAGEAQPGSQFAALGYAGDTQLGGIALGYPVIRSRPLNLNAGVQFDAFESTIDLGTGAQRSQASRDAVRTLRGGFDLQLQDDWLRGPVPAVTVANLRLHQGFEAFGSSRNGAGDVGRLGSEFDFRKITGEWSRTQPLFVPFDDGLLSLQLIAAGQWSDRVLPSVEKFYLGGNRLGRGFYSGQVTGDTALAGTAELQLDTRIDVADTPFGAVSIRPQFYLFMDRGQAFQNNDDPNQRISSWGGGVRVVLNDLYQLDVETVQRLTRNVDGAGSAPLAENATFARLLVRF